MLVHHTQAESVGIGGPFDGRLAVIHQKRTCVGAVIAQEAFYQSRFAGTVLAQESMHAGGLDFHRNISQGLERTEAFAYSDGLDADGAPRDDCAGRAHVNAAASIALSPTAPNTPPCILTILIAAA